MNKVVADADEAIHNVFDGATIMIGGVGLCGTPENLIRALAATLNACLLPVSGKRAGERSDFDDPHLTNATLQPLP
jgi:acyl CoA:acetate/3-ketoacid CoA transferase alpha subunit